MPDALPEKESDTDQKHPATTAIRFFSPFSSTHLDSESMRRLILPLPEEIVQSMGRHKGRSRDSKKEHPPREDAPSLL